MSSRNIELWTDERWYNALDCHLKGETLESKLESYIDELCRSLLPDYEYEQIGKEICREQQELEAQREANRRFAVFHVTEHGKQSCFLVERPMDFLEAARQVRFYTREQRPESTLHDYFVINFIYSEQDISAAEFEQHVSERMENTGHVTGAFDIDFDAGTFGTLHIDNGWSYFSVKNVCTAAYHASLRKHDSQTVRWERFLEHLDGKELTPQAPAQDAPGMGMEPTM